jgi:hypothetical protein
MTSPRLRDLIGVIEIAGRYMSDEQLGREIERWYRLAGEGQRPPTDVEQARDERELGRPER